MDIKNALEFEQFVVQFILDTQAPQYLEHLRHLSVEKREDTVVGGYTYFNYSENSLDFIQENKTLIARDANVDGVENGVGFALYIENGKITMLEYFTNGSENWPKTIRNLVISN